MVLFTQIKWSGLSNFFLSHIATCPVCSECINFPSQSYSYYKVEPSVYTNFWAKVVIWLWRASFSVGRQLGQAFCPKSPDPFPSSRVGSGDETSMGIGKQLFLKHLLPTGVHNWKKGRGRERKMTTHLIQTFTHASRVTKFSCACVTYVHVRLHELCCYMYLEPRLIYMSKQKRRL